MIHSKMVRFVRTLGQS